MDSQAIKLLLPAMKVRVNLWRFARRPRQKLVIDRPIFVHVPKNAGTSVQYALPVFYQLGHQPWQWYEQSVEEACLRRSFAIVRDPVSRLASAFRFLRGGRGNPWDQLWSRRNLSEFRDLEDFVLRGLTQAHIAAWVHFRPQVSFLLDANGRVGPAHLFRFEQLEESWQPLLDTFDLTVDMVHKNRTGRAGSGGPLSAEAMRVINQVYGADFQMLGYAIEHQSLS